MLSRSGATTARNKGFRGQRQLQTKQEQGEGVGARCSAEPVQVFREVSAGRLSVKVVVFREVACWSGGLQEGDWREIVLLV